MLLLYIGKVDDKDGKTIKAAFTADISEEVCIILLAEGGAIPSAL
jgi:hypothetical protein